MPRYVRRAQYKVDRGLDDGSSVFGALLTSDLPPSEKSVERLTDEGFSLFAAGTETVSWALSVITYHLFANPELLEKVTAEVTQAIDPISGELPSWNTLEKLPYLGGVIYEGLRLSYGVASRSSRIPVGEDLVYRGKWAPKGSNTMTEFQYVLPRGYAIGMSPLSIHHDEKIFPDSHSFVPERWVDDNNQHRKELDRAWLSFSKGSRGCIGIK